MSLSKNRIKFIHSLELKKNRKAENLFIAEGPKIVEELLGRFRCRFLIATSAWLENHPHLPMSDVTEVCEEELTRASLLKTPQQVLALFEQQEEDWSPSLLSHSLCLALDGVQDPGNLGTIVRVADWFGIEHIFCSANTVDAYSPKSIQATMGAIARVHIHQVDLPGLISKLDARTPIYGTFLDGQGMYGQELSSNGLIVMGNEGNGISAEVARLINRKLYIPNYPAGRPTSESLNVAIATAIVCAEFRRQVAWK
ncbi:MAG: RNA methyltransferase [Bacteroides sp.]|nr:RNA methyltransferase [Bacteroides sp.]